METLRQKYEGLRQCRSLRASVGSEAEHSGSWRQRPQRAFILKTLTLATPPSQPTHTAHTRAGCSTTGSRAWDSVWASSTLQESSHYKCVQLQLQTGWFLGLVSLPYSHPTPTMPDLQYVPSQPV